MEDKEIEEIIKIVRIYSEKNQMWLPAIKDIQTHDMDPMWVASILYLIYDRYLACIDDDKQLWFSKSILNIFAMMRKDGHSYLIKATDPDLD